MTDNASRHWRFEKKVTEETIYLSRNLKEFEKIILQQILNEEVLPVKHSHDKQLEFLQNVIHIEKDLEKKRIVYDNMSDKNNITRK